MICDAYGNQLISSLTRQYQDKKHNNRNSQVRRNVIGCKGANHGDLFQTRTDIGAIDFDFFFFMYFNEKFVYMYSRE